MMRATTEEIAAMKERLARRQADRRFDNDSAQAIAMVQKHRQEQKLPVQVCRRQALRTETQPCRSITARDVGTAVLAGLHQNGLFLFALAATVYMTLLVL